MSPLINEIILFRYPVSSLDFFLGPGSHLTTSINSSHACTVGSALSTGMKKKETLHYAWVADVKHDQQNKKFMLSLMPILSYTTRPRGFRGPWDSSEWMANATELSRLYHIPVPAAGWTPPPNPSPEAPTMSFDRGWVNSRPSWLLMTTIKVDLDYKNLVRLMALTLFVQNVDDYLVVPTPSRSTIPFSWMWLWHIAVSGWTSAPICCCWSR